MINVKNKRLQIHWITKLRHMPIMSLWWGQFLSKIKNNSLQ